MWLTFTQTCEVWVSGSGGGEEKADKGTDQEVVLEDIGRHC